MDFHQSWSNFLYLIPVHMCLTNKLQIDQLASMQASRLQLSNGWHLGSKLSLTAVENWLFISILKILQTLSFLIKIAVHGQLLGIMTLTLFNIIA